MGAGSAIWVSRTPRLVRRSLMARVSPFAANERMQLVEICRWASELVCFGGWPSTRNSNCAAIENHLKRSPKKGIPLDFPSCLNCPTRTPEPRTKQHTAFDQLIRSSLEGPVLQPHGGRDRRLCDQVPGAKDEELTPTVGEMVTVHGKEARPF